MEGKNVNEILRETFYNIGGPASLGSIENLYREVHKIEPTLTRKYVKKWLHRSYVYLLHKNVHAKPEYVKSMFTNVNIAFDCDLMDMGQGQSHQRFSLVCADRFSFKIFLQPIVNKQSRTVAKALEKVRATQNKGVWPG